jgi:hypothetical protein
VVVRRLVVISGRGRGAAVGAFHAPDD